MAARKFLEKSAAGLRLLIAEPANDHMHSVGRWSQVAALISKNEVVEKLQLHPRYALVPQLAEKVSMPHLDLTKAQCSVTDLIAQWIKTRNELAHEGWEEFALLLARNEWNESYVRHFWGPIFPFSSGKSLEEWVSSASGGATSLEELAMTENETKS